jgi:hypothetical protein
MKKEQMAESPTDTELFTMHYECKTYHQPGSFGHHAQGLIIQCVIQRDHSTSLVMAAQVSLWN